MLLGALLADVSEANQMQILDLMRQAAEGTDTSGKRREKDAAKRQVTLMGICASAIAGLRALAQRLRGLLLNPLLNRVAGVCMREGLCHNCKSRIWS